MGPCALRRLTEVRAGAAKVVFHFDVPVRCQVHACRDSWLRFIRRRLAWRVHSGRSTDGCAGRAIGVAEVYPSLWSRGSRARIVTRISTTPMSIARWLRRADLDGDLAKFLIRRSRRRTYGSPRSRGGFWAWHEWRLGRAELD